MDKHNQSQNQAQSQSLAKEYKVIQRDLVHVLVINAVFLVLLLSLYFWNLDSHVLERTLTKYLHI